MGRKVHPIAHRINVLYPWDSRWFARKGKYRQNLKKEVAIRKFLTKELKDAGLDAISIAHGAGEVTVTVRVAKPGLIIGRGGAGIEDLKKKIQKMFFDKKTAIKVQVFEVRQPSLSAAIVAQQMATEIEKRMPFRRVLKTAIERVMKAGAVGVKVTAAGRLNGVEISRRETLSDGKIPLQTFRADVDYANVEAYTIYGVIGVKVWIYKGQVFGMKDKFKKEETTR